MLKLPVQGFAGLNPTREYKYEKGRSASDTMLDKLHTKNSSCDVFAYAIYCSDITSTLEPLGVSAKELRIASRQWVELWEHISPS
jgi:hypothetical protein